MILGLSISSMFSRDSWSLKFILHFLYKYFDFLVVCKISDKILMDGNFHYTVPVLVMCTVERKIRLSWGLWYSNLSTRWKNYRWNYGKNWGERTDPWYAYLEIVFGENTTRIREMIICVLCVSILKNINLRKQKSVEPCCYN